MAISKPKTIKPKTMSKHPMYDMVQKLYSKNAPVLFFEALLFLVASALVFFRPMQTLTTLTTIFGIVLTLFGVYQICVGLLGGKTEMIGRTLNIVIGVVNVLLGLIFFFNPAASMMTIVFIFAVLFLVRSVISLIVSIGMWREKVGNFIVSTILSIIAIALAVMMLFHPAFGAVTVMYFVAITLLFYAISDIYMFFELLRLKKIVS